MIRTGRKEIVRLIIITAVLWIVWWPIVTSSNIRMDSDRMIHTPDIALSQYVQEGRSALVLLLRFFGLDTWHPVRSGILFLLFFSISCWLLYFTIRRYTNWHGRYLDLFVLLYGLSPIWAYHGYFVLQIAAVGFGMLLTVFSACMDSCMITRPLFRGFRFLWEVIALVLLTFSMLIYQSLIICYISVILVLLFCMLLKGNPVSWKSLIPIFLRLLISFAICYVISRALRTESVTNNMDVQIRWGNDPVLHCLFRIAQEAGAAVLMATSRYFSLYSLGAILALVLLIKRGKEDNKTHPLLWAACLGMLLIPFGLSVLLGNVTVPRSQFALQLVAAFLPVCFLAETKGRHRFLRITLIAVVVIQAALALRLYHTDQVRNEQDIAVTEAVTAEMEDMDTSKPLAFIGVRRMESSPVWTEKADVYGRSFFEWIYTADRPTSATLPALRLITAYNGKEYTGISGQQQEQKAVELAQDMPAYPSPGYIREEEDMIIIKLSNP